MRKLLGIAFKVVVFFWFPDFHGLWCSVMSICLSTKVKQQCMGYVSTVLGDHSRALLLSLVALMLTLLDRNSFQPCLTLN